MKQQIKRLICLRQFVAPHAGAWIETLDLSHPIPESRVAPHAGAWIETLPRCPGASVDRSPPTRGRGLKLTEIGKLATIDQVAPHAGAWIETWPTPMTRGKPSWSPPTRGRGLKLKQSHISHHCYVVAPHAGAWIETDGSVTIAILFPGRPPRGGVD